MFDQLFDLIGDLIGNVNEWLDRIFDNFESYSVNYAKYFIYALMLYLVGQFVKLNIKLDTGKK